MAFLSQAPPLGGLLPPHGAFQEYAAHPPRWPGELSSKGSSDTCISDGVFHIPMPCFHGAQWVGSGRVTLRHVSPIPPLDPCVRLSSHTAHERGDFTGNFHFTNSTDFTVVSLRIRWLPLYRFPHPLPQGLGHVRGFPAFRLLCPI